MRKEIEISVLISVYNIKDTEIFRGAIESIINQTFTNWEMLLYDDGSDETSAREIRRIADSDERIRYIRGAENRGLAHALNVCIPLAKGRYLARMDADDISKPARLERMYEFLDQHPEYAWTGCNIELLSGDTVWGIRTMPEHPKKEDFLHYSPYAHPTILFRREVLTENGGYREMRRGEDYELFMRLTAQGLQGYNIQECLFCYREDADTYKRRKFRYQIEEVRIRKEGFRRLGLSDRKTWPHVIKPVIVGLLPYGLLIRLKTRMRKEIHVERYRESKA